MSFLLLVDTQNKDSKCQASHVWPELGKTSFFVLE